MARPSRSTSTRSRPSRRSTSTSSRRDTARWARRPTSPRTGSTTRTSRLVSRPASRRGGRSSSCRQRRSWTSTRAGSSTTRTTTSTSPTRTRRSAPNADARQNRGDTMRAIQFAVCGILTLGLSGSVALGQQAGGGAAPTTLGGMTLRLPAPTNRTVDWPAASINAGFKEMVEKKLETARILEGGVFNFNVRRETAAEEGAGTHGKKSDLYLIRSGEATLTTDGQLVNPKPAGGTEGDVDGSGIRNGKSRVVRTGDVIFIPAGVPHQITAVNGEVQFLLFRWDTK